MLADEINRASPKTQSALLEVMEEGKVTVDGVTHPVGRAVHGDRDPEPDRAGRHLPAARGAARPLPHQDLLGYPDAESTEALLRSSQIRDRAALVSPVVDGDDVLRMGAQADAVFVDDAIVTYVRRLAEASREHPDVRVGLSPRGALALVRVAKVWAAADGRGHVVPQDVATLSLPVLNHRLILRPDAVFGDVAIESVIEDVVASVAAPTGRG